MVCFISIKRSFFSALTLTIFNAFVAGGAQASSAALAEERQGNSRGLHSFEVESIPDSPLGPTEEDSHKPKVAKSIQCKNTIEARQYGLGILAVFPDKALNNILGYCDLETNVVACARTSKKFYLLTKVILDPSQTKLIELASNLPPLQNANPSNIVPYAAYMKALRAQIRAIGPLTPAIRNKVASDFLNKNETFFSSMEVGLLNDIDVYNTMWSQLAFLRILATSINPIEDRIDEVVSKISRITLHSPLYLNAISFVANDNFLKIKNTELGYNNMTNIYMPTIYHALQHYRPSDGERVRTFISSILDEYIQRGISDQKALPLFVELADHLYSDYQKYRDVNLTNIQSNGLWRSNNLPVVNDIRASIYSFVLLSSEDNKVVKNSDYSDEIGSFLFKLEKYEASLLYYRKELMDVTTSTEQNIDFKSRNEMIDDIYGYISDCHKHLKQENKIPEHYMRAADKGLKELYYSQMAEAYCYRAEYDAAEVYFRLASEKKENMPAFTLVHASNTYFALKRFADASFYGKMALGRDPNLPQRAYMNTAFYSLKADDYAGAIAYYEALDKKGWDDPAPRPVDYARWAEAYVAMNQPTNALPLVKKAFSYTANSLMNKDVPAQADELRGRLHGFITVFKNSKSVPNFKDWEDCLEQLSKKLAQPAIQ